MTLFWNALLVVGIGFGCAVLALCILWAADWFMDWRNW